MVPGIEGITAGVVVEGEVSDESGTGDSPTGGTDVSSDFGSEGSSVVVEMFDWALSDCSEVNDLGFFTAMATHENWRSSGAFSERTIVNPVRSFSVTT